MKSKKMVRLYIILAVFLFNSNIQAESKNFIDNNNVYNVITEVTYIGIDIPNNEIDKYSAELYNWCNSSGKNSKKVEKLSKEINWGWSKAISEYETKEGETYLIRVFSATNSNEPLKCMTLILLSVKNNTDNISNHYDIHSIYETYVDLSQNETATNEDAKFIYYEDSSLGFSGHASVTLMGIDLNQEVFTTLINNAFNFANSDGYKANEIGELTKEQSWLLGQSLYKRSLKQGETYSISIIPKPKSNPAFFTALVIIVTIKSIDTQNGNFNYSYTAFESIKIDN